jgi:hypothetical protein
MAERVKNPVEQFEKSKEAQTIEDDLKSLDGSSLSLSDFQVIPVETATAPHPFDGYPLNKERMAFVVKDPLKGEKIVELEVVTAHVVALKPGTYVHQDPSGKGVMIKKEDKDDAGKVRNILEMPVDLKTYHNRFVQNSRKKNEDVVFDRVLKLRDGDLNVAIIPDHVARANVCFKLNLRTGKAEVDNRYMLRDFKQRNKLMQVFQIFHSNIINNERLAKEISGE